MNSDSDLFHISVLIYWTLVNHLTNKKHAHFYIGGISYESLTDKEKITHVHDTHSLR